jgi:choline dehydrogenase
LQEHPFFFPTFAAHADRLGLPLPTVGAILWARSALAGPGDLDLLVLALHYSDPNASPTDTVFQLGLALERPQARGRVRLRDRNPATAPLIALSLLGETEDRQRMVDGIEVIRRIAGQGPLAEMVAAEIVPGRSIHGRPELERALSAGVGVNHHPTSTAPMGGDDDPHAVTDWQGRVRGVDNLRVADASLLPDVPSIAPLLTIIMAAERISDWIAG